MTIAGNAVSVSQAGQSFQNSGADLVANAPALTVPAMIRTFTQNDTSSAGDPVHSCTGSADYKTVWWKVTPNSTGVLNALVRGDRLDVYGDFGIVVTAYAQTAPTVELACATVPKNNNARTTTSIQFNVTSGQTYLIEIATSGGNTAQDGGNATLVLTTGSPIPAVSVSPVAATLHAAGGSVQFNASVTGGGNPAVRWSLSPAVGSISPSGVYTPPASVNGSTTVTITASSFANPAQTGTATASVSPAASTMTLTAAGVVNAASYKGGGVSPGELVTIFGTGFGPTSIAGLSLGPDGRATTAAGATQVFFDGVPAPMVYSINGQVSAIVPYEVAGKSTTLMSVSYNGDTSAKVAVPVVSAAPGLFTLNAQGFGPLAMFNQDNSVNSASNPAIAGTVAVLFGTGEGQTNPGGIDGKLAIAPYPAPLQSVTVTIGGVNAPVQYFGAAPGLVAGVFQANVTVPAGVSGSALPVMVTVGSAMSSSAGTMAVR